MLSTVALLAVAVAAISIGPVIAGQNDNAKADKNAAVDPNTLKTKYPIKHLVVIFNENRSFDHYFGTYPNAMNPEVSPFSNPPRIRSGTSTIFWRIRLCSTAIPT